ncbi:MAG: AbrB/MazE/SpoVT family DNA-binding domain-containing protein [Geopsychrobacter sp.]|nr:AbrB/MazE/SpoVT family DNA-binding domain-containing protein [Geopsychrobacter sp.]
MLAKVQKWGNSLALRIPKALAEEIGVQRESPVNISVRDHAIVIELARKTAKYDLNQMLNGVTPENQQSEVKTGDPAGKEIW